jgi:hypothetical protein
MRDDIIVITQEGFHPYTPITEFWPMKRTTVDLIGNLPTSDIYVFSDKIHLDKTTEK